MTQDGDTVIVILTTLNNHGCVQDVDSVQVITIENPTADFSLTDSTGCHPLECRYNLYRVISCILGMGF